MITLQDKKQIRGLMQDPKWGAFETCFADYLRENFLDTSLIMEDEFKTIVNVARQDGGKYHLNNFIRKLEEFANYD
ncbi:MAG: hypothetical protein WCW65_03130 [Candidatus Paceibacterota bacterium]